MDRSVRSLISITLVLAALFVAMNRVVQNAPLVDWWLVAALLLVAILIYVWDRRAGAGNGADAEPLVEPGQSSLDGYRQVAAAPVPSTSIEPKILSQAESDHADIVQAYAEIRDTDVRSDGMASAATTDTQEARAVKDMVENIMDVGAMGTYEQVDEIAGGPVDSRSEDHPRTSPPKAEPLVTTPPPAAATPVPAPSTAAPAKAKPKASAPKPKSTPPKAASAPSKPDDLTVIEGIGPKMSTALVAGGLDSFAKLSQASEEQIRAAIEAGGMRFAPGVPTWAQQASLAAKGDWDALKTLQATLKGGRKK
jgi:predicted flap endonuclease-1-like 5' DNA nuclease